MLKTVNEIRSQISPNLQNLLNDSLIESNDPRPLTFGDEQEYKAIKEKNIFTFLTIEDMKWIDLNVHEAPNVRS